MSQADTQVETYQGCPDLSPVRPIARQRPETTDEILDAIDRSTIGDLVFTVKVWDKDTRRHREEPQLTQAGAMAVARAMGYISTGQPVWSYTEDDVHCEVPATDHLLGVTVWGTSSAPLTFTITRDGAEQIRSSEHARAIALGKAQRNAINHLVPVEVERALFEWHQHPTATSERTRSQPAPKPEPARRRRREEYIKLLRECGDSTTLAATWQDVRRDRHEEDAELMSIAFKQCRDFIGDTYTAQQWNQVKADIQAIGFLDDPEMKASLAARREELTQATGEAT